MLKERSLTSAGLRMTRASDSSLARTHRGVKHIQQRSTVATSMGWLRCVPYLHWGCRAVTELLPCLDCSKGCTDFLPILQHHTRCAKAEIQNNLGHTYMITSAISFRCQEVRM